VRIVLIDDFVRLALIVAAVCPIEYVCCVDELALKSQQYDAVVNSSGDDHLWTASIGGGGGVGVDVGVGVCVDDV
jgi:hypothetical protein